MVVLLLALLVVAWLAKDALTSYGLMGPATGTKAAAPGEQARVPAATDASGPAAEPAAPAPPAPMDRARAAGDVLKQQEGQRGGGH